MTQIDKLSLWELKLLLSDLRMYQDLRSKLGRRGIDLFTNLKQGKSSYMVEYFPIMGEDVAFEMAQKVFEQSFWEKIEREKISFVPRELLKGGMKVYKDDQMVDVSYAQVERKLKK